MARRLNGSKYQVAVIDKNNYHQFQPLFYQVATSGIEPSSISFPVRKVFHRYKNLHFRQAEVVSVNVSQHEVITTSGALAYDILEIAPGVGINYFGSKLHLERSVSTCIDRAFCEEIIKKRMSENKAISRKVFKPCHANKSKDNLGNKIPSAISPHSCLQD